MIYLLDTNVCARYLNGKSLAIRQRLRSTNIADIAVCSVVKGELFYGAMKSNNLEKTLDRQQEFLKLFVSLPFDDDASFIYGRIRAELSAKGIIIGANDLQIAAIAMVNNLILVTHNVREFSRVNGLRFEDWEE
ncbi:MAG: type II toxin-antitoxin system VapC family toxin [Dolichospermum sp.]|jgi:tRNA(fMet)-specific endonuclease VapC|uniref:type II toxin-antitoxin system tRNA(fMet)-specific endonuclease VapC n=1 Tax=Dolichospermum TaxID=748770 RepID=UPI00040AEC22|nr:MULTISPECIES: type II toxin-antitoxin system VapC family toxin [Dolichospermum]MBD1211332.1 type II toxin-antitoxin system VapC family toxin [Dolichospermum circinale Clear-D4]MDB9481620.1 type II toxin-antitoxin system VapC family toxin [Dolichospermum circinale CS-537/05]MBD2442609.1 type II toxin-antitoxin system VapC family toxin [Dolichospermum sp. FACHB-1091]MDB9453034.1 type II toxin-antitoxin system VapC family toxin [Dolichospermum circinale CS-541/06]MDB9464920.1 type II toxin-ant